jgi:hypothetical protein
MNLYRFAAFLANAFCGALLVAVAVSQGSLERLLSSFASTQNPQILLFIALILSIALVFEAVTTRIVRFMKTAKVPTSRTGSRLYGLMLERQRMRYSYLRALVDSWWLESLGGKEKQGKQGKQGKQSDPNNKNQERSIWAVIALLERFPSASRILPTSLANAVRAAEDKVSARYSLSSTVVFPRLYAILPSKQRLALDRSIARVDFSTRLACTMILAALLILPLAIYNWPLSAITYLPLWLMMRSTYRSSIEHAVAQGEQMEVAFDLYRMELLRRLNYDVPRDREEERQIFTVVSGVLSGVAAHNLRFVFSESKNRRVTIMGDQFNVEQAMAVGPEAKARAKNVYFTQLRDSSGKEIDLEQLAQELGKLRAALKEEPDTPERDSAIGAIADAETASKKGDRSKVAEFLSRAGKFALDVAEKVGVQVAVAAMKSAMGV